MQYHYDELIDNNLLVLERVTRGKNEGLKEAIVKILRSRFPALQTQAQQAITGIQDTKALEELIDQLLAMSDERGVRALLNLPMD